MVPIRIREGTPQWVGDIDHVYMGSVSEKGVRAWAPSSVMMSGYGDIVQSRLDRRYDAGAYSKLKRYQHSQKKRGVKGL